MPPIPHIMNYTGNGWVGTATMFLLLAFLLAFGKSGALFIEKITNSDSLRSRIVNYSKEQQMKHSSMLLFAASVAGIALLAYMLLCRYRIISPSALSLLIVAGVATLFCTLKYLITLALDLIFRFDFARIRTWYYLIFFFLGFCCSILALVVSYVPSPLWALFALAVVLFIYLISEIFAIVKNFSANLDTVFYIFLYLCTLEILPLAVGFRVISNVLN